MQFWSRGDNSDNLGDVLFFHVVFSEGKNFYDRIDVPFFVGSMLLANLANLIGKFLLEFIISTDQIIGELFDN